MALSPRELLVRGWGRPGPLIWARRQLLAFTLATILELCFMLTLCYYSQNYSRIIIASLVMVKLSTCVQEAQYIQDNWTVNHLIVLY